MDKAMAKGQTYRSRGNMTMYRLLDIYKGKRMADGTVEKLEIYSAMRCVSDYTSNLTNPVLKHLLGSYVYPFLYGAAEPKQFDASEKTTLSAANCLLQLHVNGQ
jgi:hypothetical protein